MNAIFKSVYPYQNDKMNLPVENVEKSLSFYTKVLGFEIVSREISPFSFAVIERNNIQIGLTENGGDPKQDGCFFEVDNAKSAFDEFKKKGLNQDEPNFTTQKYGETIYKVFFIVAPDELCYSFGERQN